MREQLCWLILVISTCQLVVTGNVTVTNAVESGNANEFIDEAIVHWRSYLKESGYDPLNINSFSRDSVNCRNCRLDGLATIYRTGDVTLNASQDFISIRLNIGFHSLYAECTCTARWTVFTAEGRMSASVSGFSLDGKIEQDTTRNQRRPELTYLEITNEGMLDSYFKGSGFIGTLVQWFGQGLIKNKIQQLLTNSNELKGIINKSLATINLQQILSLN
ncbi:hypothetical protein CHUAL_003145 [Chamberlinius hualienensis]